MKRLDLSRTPWLAVLAVVSATAAACWLRHPWSMLWIDPVIVVVVALPAVLGGVRHPRERLFWLGFAMAGVVYALSVGGARNTWWWFQDYGLALWLPLMDVANILDASLTILVAVLGGIASCYGFPWARHVLVTAKAQPQRLRFSLGTLLRIMALFTISVAVPPRIVPLAVSCIVGALFGAAVSHVLAMEPTKRRVCCTVCFGAVAGLMISPIEIAIAPWPKRPTLFVDMSYGLSLILGCVSAGAAVGFLAWHALNVRLSQRVGSNG